MQVATRSTASELKKLDLAFLINYPQTNEGLYSYIAFSGVYIDELR